MFNFLKNGFLGKKIRSLFGKNIDPSKLEELEELFYEADLGAEISHELVEKVRKMTKGNALSTEEILDAIKKELLQFVPKSSSAKEGHPKVVLIVGVNGNGKTTTIAKLAHRYKGEGKKVMIAAADTFRAAATPQLELWAERIGVELVKGKMGSDPAAVVFDAIQAANARGMDILLIDTAGRLHTKTDLMHELEKICRVANKAKEGAPHETYLVLDATIGQNGVEQANLFNQYTPLTGLILTKLDGTAKGGTALAIQRKMPIPIHYIGVGERKEDLVPFNAEKFVDALFE